MFILKRLLQLQVGRFNFRNNESLNILGSIGKKKDPVIPFDKDMMGALLLLSYKINSGGLYSIVFNKGYNVENCSTVVSGTINSGTLAPAS